MLCVCLAACNEVKDPQLPDVETIPDQVVALFEDQFPGAVQTTIKVVEKDKIWEAYYSVNARNFYAALDSNAVLASYQLISPAVPDSIQTAVSKLAIRGGTLSDYRCDCDKPTGLPQYYAKYRFQDVDYVLSWTISRSPTQYVFEMVPYAKFDFQIETAQKLPANVIRYLNADNLVFRFGKISVNESNELKYSVYASSAASGDEFIFDSKGAFVFSYYAKENAYTELKDLPAPVRNFIASTPYLTGFRFASGAFHHAYHFILLSERESYTILLDSNAKLLSLQFNGVI